jgi:hypothetical protein
MKRIRLALVAAAALCLAVAWPSGGLVFAQSSNLWHAAYYPNLDWSGAPVFVQDVPNLDLNWNSSPPGPGVPAENFTALMTTTAAFNAGTYQFSVLADDEVRLQIDGTTVLDTLDQGLSGQNRAVDVAMTAGTHSLTVYFRQYTLAAYIHLNWTPLASGAPLTLPETGAAPVGLPASTTGVVTAFGDYTRCMEQGLHQANCFVPNQEDSPNLGSIQMEPPIQIWANCTADQTMTVVTGPDNTTQDYKCSKTEAGWFPI